MDETSTAGGFITPLTPPTSIASQTSKILPAPRQTLLQRKGPKERRLLSYLDTTVDKIDGKVERRYEAIGVRRSVPSAIGYSTLNELVKDIDPMVNVLWVSGTPSIQVPFLLSISGRLIEYLGRFDFTPRMLLKLLNKVDLIFASLLTGKDYESKQPLPNVNDRTMTVTEKVRLRSIAESSRIAVVNANRKVSENVDDVDRNISDLTDGDVTMAETETETEDVDAVRRFFAEDEDEDWDMEISRVYERTLEELGGLDQGPIGVYSDYGARPFAYS